MAIPARSFNKKGRQPSGFQAQSSKAVQTS